MNHLPHLITDLALILGVAAITTLIFKKLKQPIILGYIVAGLLVGPNLHVFPTIAEVETIKIWAELGVIILLFALGLEFSFKKLVKVGGSAAVTGVYEIAAMFGLGFLVATFMGWPMMDRVFTGAIVSISSTTIIFRAFDELGLKTKQFTGLVMCVLVIEDLMAILMLVLLSTLAVSSALEGSVLLFSILKLVFFLCLWFLSGIYILPTFLRFVKKFLSNETLLIIALALCLGMVVLANKVGFSSALGAFIMVSMLADTTKAEKIEHLISSVKDLFGAIFFVSVGMLIEPALLLQYALPVLILTIIVAVGKTVNVTIGALMAGTPLKQSVQMGTSMAQIGEFSFIIATLGTSLKVTGNYLYPIAVGVSVITTFTTPYMMKFAQPLYNFLQKVIPTKWLTALNNYSSGSQGIRAESDWRTVIRSYISIVFFNSIVIVGLVLLAYTYLLPFVISYTKNATLSGSISFVLTVAAASPFLWAIAAKKPDNLAYKNLWLDQKYNHGPLLMIEIVRNLVAIALLGLMIDRFFSASLALVVALPTIVVVMIIFNKRMQSFYQRIERRFFNNLNEKENQRKEHPLTPWDAHMARFEVPANAAFAGTTLEKLQWREKYGINLAYIERGNQVIYAPSRDAMLFPFDTISVIGTDEQLEKFKVILAQKETYTETNADTIALVKISVDEHSKLKGKTIKESGIREKTNGLVVGIERSGERILNPSTTMEFNWDDVVWIVGDRKLINKYYHL